MEDRVMVPTRKMRERKICVGVNSRVKTAEIGIIVGALITKSILIDFTVGEGSNLYIYCRRTQT